MSKWQNHLSRLDSNDRLRTGLLVRNRILFGSDAKLRTLTKALHHENRQVRWQATVDLGELGADAAPAVPALVDSLSDEHLEVRRGATRALGLIGPKANVAVQLLIRLVNADDVYLRRW